MAILDALRAAVMTDVYLRHLIHHNINCPALNIARQPTDHTAREFLAVDEHPVHLIFFCSSVVCFSWPCLMMK